MKTAIKKIEVKDDIFNGYGWNIEVRTPLKEIYQQTYGEDWEYHYFLYQSWNARKF